MNLSKNLATLVALTLTITMGTAFSSNANADVSAIVSVPNGTTNFYGLVRWTLKQPGELPLYFEIEVSPGMNANDVAYSMALEADDAYGIDAFSSGNEFVALDVSGTLVTVPSEIDIDWVSTSSGGGIEPLDLDFTYDRPEWEMVLFLLLGFDDRRALDTHSKWISVDSVSLPIGRY